LPRRPARDNVSVEAAVRAKLIHQSIDASGISSS
jgi:hypothetical protein